jgi:ribonuclease P protein component
MGAAIAKKFEPSAVKRNYIKRVINAFFREHGEEIRKKYKIIVRLGRSTRDIKKRTLSRELRNDLKALLEKAGILK